MIFFKDKRGELPILVLVIGVIAICVLAIVSFSVSIFNTNNSYYGIRTMQEMNKFIEEYNFYKNAGMTFSEIENIVDVRKDGEDDYIYLEQRKNPLSVSSDIVFSVKYFLP